MFLLYLLSALIPSALAEDPCLHVPGGCSYNNIAVEQTIPAIGELLLHIAGAGGVLMVVWAGYMMLFSGGDETKFGKGKTAIFMTLAGLLIAIASQSAVQLVISEPAIIELTEAPDELVLFARAVDILVILFDIFFVLVIVYAGLSIVYGLGKEDADKKGKNMISWAVVGAIVVNLARVLVDIAIGLFT
jgi:hypothetical protein